MIKKVLLVDDDREMLLDLKESVSRKIDTVTVLTAFNGREALKCLRSQDVAMVITDLKMPEMDGMELLAAIMQHYTDIPVILMTGFGTPETERLAKQGGALEVIAKPFSADALVRRIQLLLSQQSEGGTLNNVSPAMFLQLIEMEQRTCTVRLEHLRTGSKGILSFDQGELIGARAGDVQGLDAAYEILAWEPVRIDLQNSCQTRGNRIQKNMCQLILEAARRKDEKTSAATTARAPHDLTMPASAPSESPARIRSRIERAVGATCGVEQVAEDPSWSERLQQMSRQGERLKLGKLTLACVNWGEPHDHIIRPGAPPVVVIVSPKCPREKLMQLLGE
jgi:DNA-binding response OmpR family regulator